MHGNVDGQIMAIDCRGNGVDKKRHIIVDHFNNRARRRVTVFFLGLVEDSQQRLPFASRSTKFEMVDGGSRH